MTVQDAYQSERNRKVVLTRPERLRRMNEAVRYEPNLHHLRYRNPLVVGDGAMKPRVLFIKAAPTQDDMRAGRAVYGAHRHYDDLLRSVGLDRSQAYFTHLVKYALPGNRLPRSGEVATSGPYLQEEIAILRPDIIVPMGIAVTGFFLPDLKMHEARGGTFEYGPTPLVPIFDPEVMTLDPRNRTVVFGDFAPIKEMI